MQHIGVDLVCLGREDMRAERPVARRDRYGYLVQRRKVLPHIELKTLIDALKNLSIIGALFMIAGYGRGPRMAEPAYGDV
jgi:hypothetical protein